VLILLILNKEVKMKEFIDLYPKYKKDIERYIAESVQSLGSLDKFEKNGFKKLFKIYHALELIYGVDQTTNKQTTPNIYRNKSVDTAMGKDRSYLFRTNGTTYDNITISEPYLSSATGNNCITLRVDEGDRVIFLDFDFFLLLERLNLIERHGGFSVLTKTFYSIAGASMILFSFIIIGYSFYEIFFNFYSEAKFNLDAIFKAIVALTLGLAIFDLAKTVMEQEVFFKNYSKSPSVEYKVLIKFLITIIVALSIEALMLVFKIALNDFHQMINALYLIVGIGIIILSLAAFVKATTNNKV
jgi:hypothetical protein